MVATVTLPIPDKTYHRLELNAGNGPVDRRNLDLCASNRKPTDG